MSPDKSMLRHKCPFANTTFVGVSVLVLAGASMLYFARKKGYIGSFLSKRANDNGDGDDASI